jgi:peptidoglycan/LPS O-acetylase OafA/YrhL
MIILSTFTILSFILGVILTYIDARLAFYIPFSRFWQMSIGGLIAFKKINLKNKRVKDIISVIGLFSTLIIIWIIN